MNKRVRSANFTWQEIKLLFSIVNDWLHIVESKKTDAATWKAKEAAWEAIASKYNASISRVGTHRKSQSLKKCWGNRHRKGKQTFTEKRIESLQWGGNKPVHSAKVPDEALLQCILNDSHDAELYEQFDIDMDTRLLANSNTTPIEMHSSDCTDSNDSNGTKVRKALNQNNQNNSNASHLNQEPQRISHDNEQSIPYVHKIDISHLMQIKVKSAELQRQILEQELDAKRIENELNIQILQQKLTNMKQEYEINSLHLKKSSR